MKKKFNGKKLVIQKRTDIYCVNDEGPRRIYTYLYILWLLFGLSALDNAQKICVKFEQELPVI